MSEQVLTMVQSKVARKIASHCGVSYRRFKELLDETELNRGVLYAPELINGESFDSRVGVFNLGQILNQERFKRSLVYQAIITKTEGASCIGYVSGGGVWAIKIYKEPPNLRLTGGILIDYDYLDEVVLIMPMLEFLDWEHPKGYSE